MANIVLIIGNGFDIDLGLKSKYTDFIQGKEWGEIIERIQNIPDKFQHISLLKHTYIASNAPDSWFDVENEIYKFILNYPYNDKGVLSDEKKRGLAQNEYMIIKERLCRYLLRISNDFIVDDRKWSYRLLKALTESNDNISVFSFNYTDPCTLCKLPPVDFTYIHGNLIDNDIVLGCEVMEREFIPKPLRFLIKSNMVSRPNNIIENLLSANEVMFFGHSLNVFDYAYFKEFFDYICYPIDHELDLTFITRNQKSDEDIRDNLSIQGIDVRNLFKSNIKTTFIHTEPAQSEVLKNQDSFNSLLDRIRGK